MQLTPLRLALAGIVAVFALAAAFVFGLQVGKGAAPTEQVYPADPATAIACPAPGFTATRAATRTVGNCEDAAAVQGILIRAGAVAANVHVDQREARSLTGPAPAKDVTAQVFLPLEAREFWDGEAVAARIAREVGTPIANVRVLDDTLEPLFDGSRPERAAAKPAAAAASPRR